MIYIAGDKHGYRAIQFVEEYLKLKNIPYENMGVTHEEDDIPLEEMIPKVTEKVKEHEENRGILSCGSGVGVEVGANKFAGIRAVLATNEKIAEYSVVYDKCNVVCLVGWEIDQETANKILDAYFGAEYDGSEKRLAMIKTFDTWH